MATIQIRIPDEDKKAAEAALKEMGLDMTTAGRLFYKKVAVTGTIPFQIGSPRLTVNGFTPEFEQEVLRAEKEEAGSVAFDDAEEAVAFLRRRAEADS